MTVRVAPRGASALLGALLLVTGLAPLAPAAIVAAAAPPSAPTGLSPSSGATVYANPVLSWSAVSGAARYRVQVSTAPDFSVITYAVDTQGAPRHAAHGLAARDALLAGGRDGWLKPARAVG